MEKERKVWVAGIFSLLLPGLGQLYNGNIQRAITLFALFIILGNTVFYIFFIYSIAPLNVISPLLIILLFYIFIITESIKTARKNKHIKLKWFTKWYSYILYYILGILIFSYTNIFSYDYEAFTMPSESMEDTFLVGDYFLVDKSVSSYNQNELVTFLHPEDNVTKYVKRVIALAGDTIEIKDKTVFINGNELKNPETIKHIRKQIQPRRSNGADSPDNWGPYIVPADSYFMMGDNRDNSMDSRWFGAVHKDLLIGKAIVIYYSSDLSRIGMKIQ